MSKHERLLKTLMIIRDSCLVAGRKEKDVRLVAVSKTKSWEEIAAFLELGVRDFGENYVQEALPKISALNDAKIEWHFIGRIQRNKTRKIAEHFSWVESLCDPVTAKRLNEQRPQHLPPLNVCIEVNISRDKNKEGVTLEAVLPLIRYCQSLPRLNMRGLMAMPTLHDTLAEQRTEYQSLHLFWETLHKQIQTLDTLSIGTSHDIETAIAEGSTMVRVGTRLFGERVNP